MKGETFSADRMAEEYLAYLFKNEPTTDTRRIASWLGLLILGIEKIKSKWWVSPYSSTLLRGTRPTLQT